MNVRILTGDCIASMKSLAEESVHCCVTSPPYFGLRDYGHAGQIGLEQTPAEYIHNLIDVFREVKRVMRKDGTLWLNLGDTYAAIRGSQSESNRSNSASSNKARACSGVGMNARQIGLKPKNLLGIPWRVAFALQADGWYLRQDIIWHKPNPMPESVRDRCTKAHEYIFLLSKSERYYFDAEAIAEPLAGSTLADSRLTREGYETGRPDRGFPGQASKGSGLLIGNGETRNKRSVWTVTTKPFKGAHFATFPPDLIEPCILAGAPVGGVVLDPFGGAGTTGLVASRLGRCAVLCELNPQYSEMAMDRIRGDSPLFSEVESA